MRTIKVLLLFILTIFLGGCWDRVEVNDIAIVTAIAIDLAEDERLRLSLQVAIPSKLGPTQSGGESGSSTFIISETGANVSEAYNNLQEKIGRQVFFSQSRVLLIGEDLARKGVKNIIDFHTRYHEPRINSFIMMTKGDALKVLKARPVLESIASEESKELAKLGKGITIYVRDFLDMLLTEGQEPIAPHYSLAPLGDSDEDKGQKIAGSAVFKGEKLVGWLDSFETRAILWIRNTLRKGIITHPISKEDGNISGEIIRAESKIVPRKEHGELKIDVNIITELRVIENDSHLNLNDPKVIEDLQKRMETELENRVRQVVDKVQKDYRSDIFGFGQTVYKKYPNDWNSIYKKKWDEMFSQLDVSINAEVYLRRVGLRK
ncbi:Ger(x)C family spore germination protein [Metabacillus niabensis]|uniref:Spore germination protein KC n=1 Tax=Metabacillus niabensis TaxID=324854 RepID=A0ABT9Z5I4_9BACI|nr:Ger(x)C family spore germination protein [Metabacillus niabensis]MDQ0227516.1 spore germination protein KC [Metabacillus niabensis]